MTSVSHSSLDRSTVNAWELLIWGTVTGEGSNRNHGYFLWSILQYFFCFVLCIHLVPSCNSLLMFVSYFSVYLIIILMYLFMFYLLIYLFCQWKLGFHYSFAYLLFICKFTQSVKFGFRYLFIYISICLCINLDELSYICSHIICIFFH